MSSVLEELRDARHPIPMTTLPMVEFAELMSNLGIGGRGESRSLRS
jgi:hypothetical protein